MSLRAAFLDLSIRQKLTWASTIASGLALLLACGAFLANEFWTFRDQLVETLRTRAQILAANSTSAVIFFDQRSAEETLGALQADDHVLSAGIYTPEGVLFASYVADGKRREGELPGPPQTNPAHRFDAGRLALYHPVVSEGKQIGTLFIESDLRQLDERIVRYLVIVALVLLVSLLFARVVAAPLQRTITGPILSLVETTRRVSRERDYSVRATQQSGDELGLLVEGFNEMLTQIEQRDEALRRARDELEERVAERTRELSRSNAELEQFAYVASHDLQEPLRMVGSYTQLLARRYQGKLDADADEFIGYAVDGVSRMQSLINDLLAFSRVGTRGKAFEPTPLGEVFDEVVANLRAAIDESGAAVTHDPLPEVTGDRSQLLQLLQNLVSNSLKFRGDTPPRVHVGARREGNQWVLSVADNGIGIDPAYAERIFVIFQRLHNRAAYPGTGIGLAICKKIVERHGGRIWVESESGRGSTFLFTIPDGRGVPS